MLRRPMPKRHCIRALNDNNNPMVLNSAVSGKCDDRENQLPGLHSKRHRAGQVLRRGDYRRAHANINTIHTGGHISSSISHVLETRRQMVL